MLLNFTVSQFLVFQTMYKSSQIFYSPCFITLWNEEFLKKKMNTLSVHIYITIRERISNW